MVKEKLIKREILDELRRDLPMKEMAFLLGPRQSGKTTLMKMLQAELDSKNERTVFLSLDFEYDRVHFHSQQNLLRKIELEIGSTGGVVFIDEVQRKDEAGLFFKGIQDMELPYKFILTGSGSVDLKSRIKESMIGRKRVYELYPISITEFINHKTDYRYEQNLKEFIDLDQSTADRLLIEYMNYGGYPRIVLEEQSHEKLKLIDEIYQSYIAKDISFLLKVEKIDAFNTLVKLLADQAGRMVNYSELSSTIGISLATLKNYLSYAEGTYILKRLNPFHRNVRSAITKSPTVYFNDTGFRNYALGMFGRLSRSDDMGFAFQNLVYLVLRQKIRWLGAGIHYWRTKSGGEIDFVISIGKKVMPVEVKFQKMQKPAIPRSLYGFLNKYGPERSIIINRDLKTTVKVNNCDVMFITLWDLLFETSLDL